MAISQQKLVSIKVTKLKNLIDLDMDFCGSPVTAILGPNGNGKSTVLHALACVYQPANNGENHKFSEFFLPNTDALWNDSNLAIVHSFRDGKEIHENISVLYEKMARWTPIYARRPKRDIYYIGIDKCVPMIETEKKQAKINYETNSMEDDIFNVILQKASQILNKKYLKYNIHSASGKDFIGVEVVGLKYSALSMSAGEQKVFHILEKIFNAPKYSMILIDELDLLLHDKAIISLIKVIHSRALEKELQIIFTTHRESVIGLSSIINIRHLFSTPTKTLSFNETKPDAINRLTGNQPKPIEIFVEDDLSAAIISKLSSQLGGIRLISIQRFGAAINGFTAVAGLLFSNQSIDDSLFVLDGDVYSSNEEKETQLDRVITGTDELARNYKARAMQAIKQYTLPENFKPEPYLHHIISHLNGDFTEEQREIISIANDIHVADESHKYIDDIIFRLGLDRRVGLSKVVDLVATTDIWNDYTAEIRIWLQEKILPLLEQQNEAALVD